MQNNNDSSNICRYFSNGICAKGEICKYSHDVSKRSENICRFYQSGRCSFGTACKFHHVKSKPIQNQAMTLTKMTKPPPRLAEPGLNVSAEKFVPSWEKKNITSYSTAVQSSSGSSIVQQSPETRSLCPYFETTGECKSSGEKCAFVHGELCDMCNQWALHPFSEEKRSSHLKECTAAHERAMEEAFIDQRSHQKSCGICMENIIEKDLRFGILNGCQHCFCLDCIRQWRAKHETTDLDSKVVRSCPECRQHSDYVVPSVIWVEEKEEKDLLISMYKENLKSKVCKYYNGATRGICPFGNKCFYKHQLPDGSTDPGESPRARRRPRLSDWFSDSDEDDFYSIDIDS